jgi:endonuclease/exonuclease/phosphatase family metal-dependent hydrolase
VGHHDVSDHRFEQRGLLHVPVIWQGTTVHAVVAHLGLIHASRVRQVQRLAEFIDQEVPREAPLIVAGDFNDWGERLDAPMAAIGLARAVGARARPTFPSRVPVFALDRIYTRSLACRFTFVPRGGAWARMSDHLPLVAEFELA